MIYRTAKVTGNAMIELISGLMNPKRAAINPIGKARETAPSVNKLVRGAIRETYPKCMAVKGIVSIRAPAVVARLDVIKLMTALGTRFRKYFFPRKESATAEFIRDVMRIIPRVAENDNCNPIDAHE